MRKAPAILIVLAALALGGCGYKPLYGSTAETAGVSATLASVSIPEASDRVGQLIRNDLISSMRSGSGEDRYTLLLKPVVRNTGMIKKEQPNVTRQAINLSVSFELIERSTGKTLHQGKTFSQASFDVIRQPFADLQAETNATERAAHEVSGDIRTRLAAYFASRSAEP
ncbi:LPS assembly lipoprotein LptE [Aestuariivirga sp.]|uniref:LPS assembly lipoprotein LptE n=1 Tax=Aestuariivirga sp. TaxID=2650926 RepID=UPI003592FE17